MEVNNLNETPEFIAPDKAVVREWVSPSNSRAKTISMADIVIPPGVQVQPHYHIVLEEHYFIMEGEGEMEIGDSKQLLKAGDAVVILPRERHTITNHTDQPLKMLVTCVPAWTPEDQVFVD